MPQRAGTVRTMPPRVGDKVIVPWRLHRNGTDVIGGWHPGEVVAKRRGRLVVLIYGHERDYAAFWVKPYPVRWQDWPWPLHKILREYEISDEDAATVPTWKALN